MSINNNNSTALVLGLLTVTATVLLIAAGYKYKNKDKNQDNKTKEQFTTYYIIPPNWFFKQDYNPSQWLVREYQDRIQPTCLPYSLDEKYGSLENLNYLSSAYRFWRM